MPEKFIEVIDKKNMTITKIPAFTAKITDPCGNSLNLKMLNQIPFAHISGIIFDKNCSSMLLYQKDKK